MTRAVPVMARGATGGCLLGGRPLCVHTDPMRRATACLAIILAGLLIWYYDRDLLHFLGWDGQTSDNYAAWSGSVPALIAMLGYVSLFASLVHRFNCHQKGCWRPGRHQIGSGVWCNRHEVNARPERSIEEILTAIEARLPDLRNTPEAP